MKPVRNDFEVLKFRGSLSGYIYVLSEIIPCSQERDCRAKVDGRCLGRGIFNFKTEIGGTGQTTLCIYTLQSWEKVK